MTNTEFPLVETHLPQVMTFVSGLVQDYRSGKIQSWEMMTERVHSFFTPEMLDKVDAVAPGWREMSSCANGVTLVHVMCVFVGLLTCPEYQHASNTEQVLMKWIVLFHDLAKEVCNGQRDYTHGFRSAAKTGAILPRVGFSVMPEYENLFQEWFTFTTTATTKHDEAGVYIQDNRKLPEIITGTEQLFGYDTPATLIVKTVLLHSSIDVVEEWPQVAPLTESEIRRYLNNTLFPLLKMMMLVDNDGWVLFDLPTKEQYRQETLSVFGKLAPMLVGQGSG